MTEDRVLQLFVPPHLKKGLGTLRKTLLPFGYVVEGFKRSHAGD